MNKKMKLEHIKDRLSKLTLSSEMINDIIDIVEPMIDGAVNSVDEKRKILNYANKLYSDKYPDEIFFDEQLSPKIRIDMTNFMKLKKLSYDDMKHFVKWVIEFCEQIMHRKPIIYDLYREVLYKIYLERDRDEEILNKKSIVKRKKIFIIQQ